MVKNVMIKKAFPKLPRHEGLDQVLEWKNLQMSIIKMEPVVREPEMG